VNPENVRSSAEILRDAVNRLYVRLEGRKAMNFRTAARRKDQCLEAHGALARAHAYAQAQQDLAALLAEATDQDVAEWHEFFQGLVSLDSARSR